MQPRIRWKPFSLRARALSLSALSPLAIQGQERANHLYRVFDGSRLALPSKIFANNYYEGAGSDPDRANCERCWLTVQPLAQHLHLSVAFEHGFPEALGGNKAAATAIKRAAQNHSVVLAAWEHVNIQFLTADLGVPKSQIPHWRAEDYDTVYIVNLTASGALRSFGVHAQSYTPQSTTCPPKFVPPGSSPTPPSPVPPSVKWECHAQRTTSNAVGLEDADLRYVGSGIADCQNECNARAGCTVIVWYAADEHCRVLSGAATHDAYLTSLVADPGRSTCLLVAEHRANPPTSVEQVEAEQRSFV